MSIKFTEAFDKLLDKIPNLEESWLKEEEEITQKIYQAFHDTNSIFKGTLSHLKETNIQKKKYQTWIQVTMPFPIYPNKLWENTASALYKLRARRNLRHPAVKNAYLVPERLRSLFDTDLKRAVGGIGEVTCQSGKVFTLSAESEKGDIDLYSIDVTGPGNGQLSYHFLLALKFSNDPKMYIPFFGEHLIKGAQFMVLKEQIHLDEFIGKTMSVKKFLNHLGVEQNEETNQPFLRENIENQTVSDAVLKTLKCVIMLSENPERLSLIYNKLEHFKQVDSVELSELMALIDLN
ncbi:GL22785 [Drosophila persimilis]|uniref:GL22785 n=1 Tax=Drosophila persimilis TaxID=7234 RepID=B4GZK2_DROPE|nr:uncharacterized protein LOC6598994 [Drosophila persimilis]EDW29429.1 GL22785 [Drosophila persimilis]